MPEPDSQPAFYINGKYVGCVLNWSLSDDISECIDNDIAGSTGKKVPYEFFSGEMSFTVDLNKRWHTASHKHWAEFDDIIGFFRNEKKMRGSYKKYLRRSAKAIKRIRKANGN